MKERPILFNGEMVRALLEDRKRMTRRVVKTQPDEMCCFYPYMHTMAINDSGKRHILCPYGQPGDRLWVRETWRVIGWREGEPVLIEYSDCTHKEADLPCLYDDTKYTEWEERMWLQSGDDCLKGGMVLHDDLNLYVWPDGSDKVPPTRWRPSIHMPRWASRITLEVTAVRVERLHDISEADAIAEGVQGLEKMLAGGTDTQDPDSGIEHALISNPVTAFSFLWEEINGAASWDANPFVWVVEFKRIMPK